MRRVPPRLKANARRMRRERTDAEAALWYALRGFRPAFTTQFVVAGHILDMVCRRARLAAEVDGGQHCADVADEMRTVALERQGWRVVRFWNHDVLGNTDGVMEVVLAAVRERVPPGVEVSVRAARERKKK